MKKLHNGNTVADSVPTKIVDGKRYKLSQKEIEARAQEELKEKQEFEKIAYIGKRNAERGSLEEQLEYLAENGLEAFLAREYDIRAKHLKPGQKKPNMKKPNGTTKPKITEKIKSIVSPAQPEGE